MERENFKYEEVVKGDIKTVTDWLIRKAARTEDPISVIPTAIQVQELKTAVREYHLNTLYRVLCIGSSVSDLHNLDLITDNDMTSECKNGGNWYILTFSDTDDEDEIVISRILPKEEPRNFKIIEVQVTETRTKKLYMVVDKDEKYDYEDYLINNADLDSRYWDGELDYDITDDEVAPNLTREEAEEAALEWGCENRHDFDYDEYDCE